MVIAYFKHHRISTLTLTIYCIQYTNTYHNIYNLQLVIHLGPINQQICPYFFSLAMASCFTTCLDIFSKCSSLSDSKRDTWTYIHIDLGVPCMCVFSKKIYFMCFVFFLYLSQFFSFFFIIFFSHAHAHAHIAVYSCSLPLQHSMMIFPIRSIFYDSNQLLCKVLLCRRNERSIMTILM